MDRAYNFLYNTLDEEDIVVLGCSGGPDSMALLYLLINIRIKKNIKIICAHINHNIRKESKLEEINLKKYCNENDIVFESMTILNYGDDNFHNEARTIRYHFFEDTINKYHAKYLLTAHHGDDLIETVLMRIVRGSTLKGYAGFSKFVDRKNYSILRPLINCTKKEILDFNKKNRIWYAIDKSNFKTKYTRNRYRKVVLPFLKKEDDKVHEKFLKFSESLEEVNSYLEEEARKIKKKVYSDKEINILELKNISKVLQTYIIYSILEEVYRDDLFLVTDKHVEMIRELLYTSKTNLSFCFPNEVSVVKSYNNIIIRKDVSLIPQYDIEIGTCVKLPNGKNISFIDNTLENTNYYCRLNEEDIKLPLYARTRRNGDKIEVKGMTGHKKVKDIFIDSKVPIKDRDLWPIVVDSTGKIVWIPGIKKSKYDVPKNKKCDIILKYH